MSWQLIQGWILPSPIVYPPLDPERDTAVMKTRVGQAHYSQYSLQLINAEMRSRRKTIEYCSELLVIALKRNAVIVMVLGKII